jgi:hypothetical protein
MFNRAIKIQMSSAITLYMIVASVIYYLVGPSISGLALSSADPFYSKVAYGIASFTIVIAGVVNAHVACKFVYRRWFPRQADRKGLVPHLIWNTISFCMWLVAFLLAVAVPSFQHILGIISAVFMAFISFGLGGVLWLKMNRGNLWVSKTSTMLTLAHIGMILIGVSLSVLGLYGTAMEIKGGHAGKAFDCKQNYDRIGRDAH